MPANLALTQQTIEGQLIEPGRWMTGLPILILQAPYAAAGAQVPEVEVAALGTAFTGEPSQSGAPMHAQGGVLLAGITLKALSPGRYHWQARFVDQASGQVGAWTMFAGGEMGFGIISGRPLIEDLAIDGATHRVDDVPITGASDAPNGTWSIRADPLDSVDFLAYEFTQQTEGETTPPRSASDLDPTRPGLPLPDLSDGRWFLHLWAIDRAGQTSRLAALTVLIQRTPPQVTNLIYRTWVTNPEYQVLPIRFSLTEPATVKVTILPINAESPLRTFILGRSSADQRIEVVWGGKDTAGGALPNGPYRFRIDIVDDAGNPAQVLSSDLHLTDEIIQVWLAKQSLSASDANGTTLTSRATPGGQALPAHTGTFEVESKGAPFVFNSPYPRGSRFWYPDTPANSAMLFDPSEANFLYGAPWRPVFGPGTNGPGSPGHSIWAGSHDCVELPTSTMKTLFDWSKLGTPVIVHD